MRTKVSLLIRKPVNEVFQAFINPEISTRFWFSKSSGKLVQGEKVTWEWEMYGVTDEVVVEEIVPNERIHIQAQNLRETIFRFEPFSDTETIVEIENGEFETVEEIIDTTEGYTLVLSGLKAVLEHDLDLHLIEDKHPHDRV